jgi:nitrate reductase (cytochrome), electron transfer subunit
MRGGPLPNPAVRRRVLRIGAAVAMMAAAVVLLDWLRARAADDAPPGATIALEDPIPAEAGVFRLRPGDLALDPGAAPRSVARRRTLADFRELRAYPGAPPRIPHAVTAEEFRATTCNACHAAGGYSRRFGAYVPVTPHPEYRNCLQCHAADAGAVEVALPAGASAFRASGGGVPALTALDWATTAWPRTGVRAMEGSPPAIPHDLQLRGNCLACHAGPSAVAEIRTTHPERANCRQCHVPAEAEHEEHEFTRPLRPSAGGGAR